MFGFPHRCFALNSKYEYNICPFAENFYEIANFLTAIYGGIVQNLPIYGGDQLA